MPPRSRKPAEPKPATEENAEPLVTDEPTPEPQDSADARGDEPTLPDDTESQRSDLQTAEEPCVECFPNGWPEQSFAVGCTHGTWVRD